MCTPSLLLGIVKVLVSVARTAQKEKVFRVAIMSLVNLLNYEDLELATDMVSEGLPKTVATRQLQVGGGEGRAWEHPGHLLPAARCRLAQHHAGPLQALSHRPPALCCLLQSWGDEDIVEMLQFLDTKLKEGIQTLSSFDMYKKEVASGALDWTHMHTSDKFWKDNIDKFEEKDFQVLRMLLKLIESSREVSYSAEANLGMGRVVAEAMHLQSTSTQSLRRLKHRSAAVLVPTQGPCLGTKQGLLASRFLSAAQPGLHAHSLSCTSQ